MPTRSSTKISVTRPNIIFQQPLFHSEHIAANWHQMRSQLTSATQLEAAYRVIEPEVAALHL